MTIAITKDQEMAAHWKTQIEQCDKEYNAWIKRGEKILKNYRDDRDERDNNRRLNLFWSNVQTLKPAIYSNTPVPICERRFLDKDTTGRVAATILERNLRYEVATSGYNGALKRVRNDYLTVSRGQVWIRYNPKFGEPISPKQQANDEIDQDGQIVDEKAVEAEEAQEREVLSESLEVSYLHWKDFYIFPAYARTWDEVEGVGRKLYMSRQDCIDNFDETIGKAIELDYTPKGLGYESSPSTLTGTEGMQATIFEIWWKPDRKVYFIAKSYDKICKEADDPLKLEKFFPCPEPICATLTNDSLIPVADYVESQDQYQQIDDLTKRIDILTSATRVVGVYDSSAQSLKRVFQEAQEPNLIPVDSWAMFAEKGGLKGAIDWVPIEQVAKTLKILIEVRAQIIEDLDRTTGIMDIMRGTSDARETMGAQRLKTNNASTRLTERQDDMARFNRDIICIMGEIISEHYDPQTLVQVSGALYDEGLDPPDLPPNPMMGHNGGPPLEQAQPGQAPQAVGSLPGLPQPAPETPEQKLQRKMELIAKAIELLRQDKLRGFRIDIETDSTVQGDAQTEKAQRIEFIEGVTKFVEVAGQTTAMVPEFAPLAAKMLAFGVRGFRVGRDLESAIEEFCDKVEQQAKKMAGQPKPPSPEEIKAQTEKMKADQEMQTAALQRASDEKQAAAEVQRQALENQNEAANRAAETRMKEMDVKLKEMDIEIAKIKAQADLIKVHRDGEREDKAREHESRKMDREDKAGDLDLTEKTMKVQKLHENLFDQTAEPIKDFMAGMVELLQGLQQKDSQPIEFVRGKDGKTTHVKKGDRVLTVHRGADGKAARVG